MFFDITSDFIGPLPTGTNWFIKFTADSEGANIVASITIPATTTTRRIEMDIKNTPFTFGNYSIPIGQDVHVISQLVEPGFTVVDSGAATMPWVQSSDDYRAIILSIPAAGTGLTTAQAAQLTQVVDNTTSSIQTPSGTIAASIGELLGVRSISTLTEAELTSGPTGGFVGHDLPVWVQAIIIRIATVAPIDVPLTPDSGWFPRDLAVVNIFHGSDLYMRVAVHTISRVIQVGPSDLHSFAIQALETAVWPESVSLQVTFAAGVTGQVFEAILP